jgi:hypothetical protein
MLSSSIVAVAVAVAFAVVFSVLVAIAGVVVSSRSGFRHPLGPAVAAGVSPAW